MRATCRTSLLFVVGLLLIGASRGRSADQAIETSNIRFGNAAGPFGWATTVADFNGDGAPDFAIADKARSLRGSIVKIEFAVSGTASYSVAFESPHRFVTLSVADVDHDSDLDLLVSIPLSGTRVAVWINDGRGHFSSSDLSSFERAGAQPETIRLRPPPEDASLAVAPDRSPKMFSLAVGGALPVAAVHRVASRSNPVVLDRAVSHALLRAPPSAPFLTA